MTATITFNEADALELVKAGLAARGYDAKKVQFAVSDREDFRGERCGHDVRVVATFELPAGQPAKDKAPPRRESHDYGAWSAAGYDGRGFADRGEY